MKYSELTTKKAKVEFLREKLSTDAAWAVRGMLKIYEFQTANEKELGGTVEDNGVGFSGADGDILSSFAEQIKAGRQMSLKQMGIIYKKMPRYSNQLAKIVEREQTMK